MKFKEFYVVANNKYLLKAIKEHAFSLGYKKGDFYRWDETTYFKFFADGDLYSCINPIDSGDFEKITVEDFFKLTPEDVRVEPKKQFCDFNVPDDGLFSNSLTQDQIDRIKAIMNEGQS